MACCIEWRWIGVSNSQCLFQTRGFSGSGGQPELVWTPIGGLCEHEQKVHFNIQDYLLGALQAEQRQIAQEVHLLALTYRWNLNDILSLPRRQRRAYVALIQSQADSLS